MLIEVNGIVLQETPYGETSKIINILTKEKGLIGIMCKGAKSMKSQFRANTQLFTIAKFTISYKEGRLSTLTGVDILDSLKNIRSDLIKISYASYICDLTLQVVRQNPAFSVYDMLTEILLKIESNLDPLILTNILELKYLPLLGVGLNLDECIRCSSTKDIVTIDASYGGLICKNCYRNEIILDKKVIQLLRLYYYVDIKSITTIKVEEKYSKVINHFINDYYESFTGLYLNSKKFLETLI